MFLKYIQPILLHLLRTVRFGFDVVRGMKWPEVRDLLQFASRRVREESLPQIGRASCRERVF